VQNQLRNLIAGAQNQRQHPFIRQLERDTSVKSWCNRRRRSNDQSSSPPSRPASDLSVEVQWKDHIFQGAAKYELLWM
jgi:hypothetical protein